MKKNTLAVKILYVVWKIVFMCLIILAIVFCGRKAYNFGSKILVDKPLDREPGISVTVSIEDGTSAYSIGKLLKQKGLIDDAAVFYLQAKLSGYDDKLQPGNYILNSSTTPKYMMGVLAGEIDPDAEESDDEVQ